MAMDNASQLEIINLLREDAEVLGTTTDRTDLMLALQVWQEEVDHYVALEEDRRMALGAVRTTHEDRGFEIAAQLEEAQAAEDRRLAIRLAGQQRPHPQERRPPVFNVPAQAPVPAQAIAPAIVTGPDPVLFPGPAAEPQHAKIERRNNQNGAAVTTFDCIACTETTPLRETIETACSHHYCPICITKLFDDFINNESPFPPRCCNTNIPLTLVQRFLSPDLRKRFRDKLVEHNDPNRTYCSVSTCSQYLFANTAPSGANSRYCKRCARWTCVACKKCHVPWVQCPADDERVLQLGRERGWKQCPRCKHLIELAMGCYHVRCRCSDEFCYGCGVTWKQCGCQLWDPQRFPHLNE